MKNENRLNTIGTIWEETIVLLLQDNYYNLFITYYYYNLFITIITIHAWMKQIYDFLNKCVNLTTSEKAALNGC